MKKKKIPMRKCILSNEMHPKKDMIRVVVNKEGEIFADVTGKKQGRGAYVSKDVAMVEKAQQKEILPLVEKYKGIYDGWGTYFEDPNAEDDEYGDDGEFFDDEDVEDDNERLH